MVKLRTILLVAAVAVAAGVSAQSRSVSLTISVTAPGDGNLSGQQISLMHTDYSAEYPGLKLDADGICKVKVYPGNHELTIEREGYERCHNSFAVAETPAEQEVTATLTEQTRKPFALTATHEHDAMTGADAIALSWNIRPPVFFDDFESYEPFAVTFGAWTGIDGDGVATAALAGSYPNRGIMQYAQIMNPLAVTPPWWYEYPVLRPFSGQQYVGFVRTSGGSANDDWLISPAITPDTDNVLEFMAKAADRYTERFMVYVTTVTDNPTRSDFVRLDKGNYETVDHRQWHKMSYDLSAYADTPIKFAIRYMNDASRYGAFMLMVDDVYVGAPRRSQPSAAARRIARSPDNPNEKFEIYYDGQPLATTEDYSYTIADVSPGSHTVGIKAKYLSTESETATITIDIPKDVYTLLTINVTADSKLAPDGQTIDLLDTSNSATLSLKVAGGKAVVPSLPHGSYEASIASGAFEAWHAQVEAAGASTTVNAALKDNIIDPWNITATPTPEGLQINWNRNLGFTDSFEEYADFATGEFGDWLSVDNDRMPVYPIGLGGNTVIVAFPGSGTATSPKAIAPIVFNPWTTQPPMLPADPAIQAPDGDKTIVFFSPQAATADKWLIAPQMEIRQGYEFSFLAKAYSSAYRETMEICVSEEGAAPADFAPIASLDKLEAEQWMRYVTTLDAYAGKKVRVAIHYTSHDAFFAQVDQVSIGPPDGEAEVVDYGNVVHYEIWLGDNLHGTSETPDYLMKDVAPGRLRIGIRSVYKSGASGIVYYDVDFSGIGDIRADSGAPEPKYYDISGKPVDISAAIPGVYVKLDRGKATKIIRQ